MVKMEKIPFSREFSIFHENFRANARQASRVRHAVARSPRRRRAFAFAFTLVVEKMEKILAILEKNIVTIRCWGANQA